MHCQMPELQGLLEVESAWHALSLAGGKMIGYSEQGTEQDTEHLHNFEHKRYLFLNVSIYHKCHSHLKLTINLFSTSKICNVEISSF